MKLWVQQEFSVLHPFGQVWTILIVIYSQCGVPGPFRHTFFFLCDHLRQSCVDLFQLLCFFLLSLDT